MGDLVEKLLPCPDPECGCYDVQVHSGQPGCHWVNCRGCGLQTNDKSRDRVIAQWNRLPRKQEAQWFYLAGDMSSGNCRFSVYEVIDGDWLWDHRAEGDAIVQIETATPLPDIWCAVHFFTDAEKAARGLGDSYELTMHATKDAACAAIAKVEGRHDE